MYGICTNFIRRFIEKPILVEQIKLAEKTGKPLFPIVLSLNENSANVT